MKDCTLERLIFGSGDFKTKYETLKKGRILQANSVNDFLINKKGINTPISDLVFLSKTRTDYIHFRDVYIDKFSDEVYDVGDEGDKGYFVRLYIIRDETGEFPCLWPTKDSKLSTEVSCDRFETMKNFSSNLIKNALILYDKKEEGNFLYWVNLYTPRRKKKIDLKELVPSYLRI